MDEGGAAVAWLLIIAALAVFWSVFFVAIGFLAKVASYLFCIGYGC